MEKMKWELNFLPTLFGLYICCQAWVFGEFLMWTLHCEMSHLNAFPNLELPV